MLSPSGREIHIGPERVIALVLIALLAIGCLVVLRPFLSSLLWAAILAYATFPVFAWLRAKSRLSGGWIATLMVLTMACVVIVPLTIAIPASGDDLNALRGAFIARGAFIRPIGSVIYLAPALTMDSDDVAFLTRAIADVLRARMTDPISR